MKDYFAKIKIQTIVNPTLKLVVFKINSFSESHVKLKIIKKLTNWQNLKSYEIIKISTEPIDLFNYMVTANVFFHAHYSKPFMFKIWAENQSEAETIFTEIVQNWKQFYSLQIINIYQI